MEESIKNIQFHEISRKLDLMRETDQNMRNSKEWDKNVDIENTEAMKAIIAEIGWPTVSKVGEKSSHAAWLLVQHADHDPEFQTACLTLMKEQTEGEVSIKDVAYLEDRVRVSTGQKQVYGSQFKSIRDPEGLKVISFEARPIEDEEHVNERRASIGLEPIEEYRERLIKRYADLLDE